MKKITKICAALLLTTSALAGCSSNTGSTKNIRIQLTPSREGVDLSANAATLKPILEKYAPGYTFTVSVGTTFAADGLALAAGSIDASFITASAYAQTEIANKGKVDMILRASRSGFKVIHSNVASGKDETSKESRDLQLVAMNEPGKYYGEPDGVASYYYAECIMMRDKVTEFDTDGDGKVSLKELAGKKIGLQGVGSPAGYSYPLFAFSQETNNGAWANGMKPVEKNPDATKGEFQNVSAGSYGNNLTALKNGEIDAFWSYMDVRNDQAKNYNANNLKAVYDDTYTVALTQGILNDGVAVRSNLDDEAKTAIAKAFKDIMTKGGNPRDNGKGTEADKDANGCYDIDGDGKASDANAVFSLYSHTGYIDAKNSDYDDEITFQKWASQNLTSK